METRKQSQCIRLGREAPIIIELAQGYSGARFLTPPVEIDILRISGFGAISRLFAKKQPLWHLTHREIEQRKMADLAVETIRELEGTGVQW